jgi:hypothetical protein
LHYFPTADGTVLDDYPAREDSEDEKSLRTRIGGIEIVTWKVNECYFGFRKWHTQHVKAVAVDGQHRLSALKMYKAKHDVSGKRLPVTVMVFGPGRRIIEQVREVFVDLNKNARRSTKSREILLDDRSIPAVLAKDLMRQVEGHDYIPELVVDWRTDAVKPEGPNQLTTLVTLHEILLKGLFSSRAQNLSRLTLKGKPLDFEDHGFATVSNLRDAEPNRVHLCIRAFNESWRDPLIHIFNKFSPFADFLKKAEACFTGNSYVVDYLRHSAGRRDKFKDQLQG